MPFSASDFMENPPPAEQMAAAGRAFAEQVSAELALTSNKDIFIYIPGYNVDFDYATLVSRELQHFLGYQGAFISYNWTATPSRFAYFKDQESASATRRYLRSLVEFLSTQTDARVSLSTSPARLPWAPHRRLAWGRRSCLVAISIVSISFRRWKTAFSTLYRI